MSNFICIAKCPELDRDNTNHCIISQQQYDDKDYSEYCPCGNIPKWQERSEDNE